MKRIAVATLCGLGAGSICATALFSSGLIKFSFVLLAWTLLNRAVMGFAIGTSKLQLPWAWNGVIIGMAVGSIFSYFLFMSLGPGKLPFINFFANGIFGLLIEFFTTVVFRQPAFAPLPGRPLTVSS
ncbi:MAG: hypothetical protein WBS19_18375 [Candidatus Korobacteraceae bacterium]